MFKTTKEIGEWGEMQFMPRAAANGFTVCKPWGDSARYDFAIEKDGVFHRIQVKCSASLDRRSYVCNIVWSAPKGRTRRYRPEDVDFFAILIIPEEVWYIIPMADLKGGRTCFYVNPRNPKNRYFRYLEAWHLLQPAPTRVAHARVAHAPSRVSVAHKPKRRTSD